MSVMTTTAVPFLRSSEFALACALADARWEAARTLHVRYVVADAAGGWRAATDKPRERRECYRVFPGGHVEHHPADRLRRRS